MKLMPLLLTAGLAGCATMHVEKSPAAAPGGQLAVQARRHPNSGRLEGYAFEVERDGRIHAQCESRRDGPVIIDGLEPGYYRIRVHGPAGREGAWADVEGGRRTSVTLITSNARPAAQARLIAGYAGEALLYLFAIVARGVLLCVEAALEAEDECSRCDRPCSRCRCSRPQDPSPKESRPRTGLKSKLKKAA